MPQPDDMIPAWLDGHLVTMDKLEVHRRGLPHPAVSVFVLDGPRVLIQRRALTKYHSPGLWANTVCTHPRPGEAAEATAQRRLKEELGIEGLCPTFVHRLEYRADVGGGMTEHELVDVFLAYATPGMTIAPDPAEVAEIRWVGLYDLAAEVRRHPDRFTRWLEIYLLRHMSRIFGRLPNA